MAAVPPFAVEPALSAQPLRICIAGNPNSGKTTLFNALTGSRYKVANYPGVTVERKSGTAEFCGLSSCVLSDLPGIYSLVGSSLDERVAASALRERPDAIIAVVDAANLERNLYLVSELIDLGIPLLLAVNMYDVAQRRGIHIDSEALAARLDVPVVLLSASRKEGVAELRREVGTLLSSGRAPSAAAFAWNTDGVIDLDAIRSPQSLEGFGDIATARYRWINGIVRKVVEQRASYRDRTAQMVDAVATHRLWGLLLFAAVMALIFQSIFTGASLPMDAIDAAIGSLSEVLAAQMTPGLLRSLLIDGVLAGVGSVVIFVPQIALLFFFIGLLEDSGYLCRAAFVMDRVMRKFGLQGRSFIPLLSSFACAVPGIMSTRSISSVADRFITILVAPLMSCSARLPVYALLIAAFIPEQQLGGVLSLQGLVLLALYLLGIVFAAIVALALKKTAFRGEPALFIMEMPPFRIPSLRLVLREVFDRVMIFLKSAGTIIFACSIVLWFLASFPTVEGEPVPVAESYAGSLGKRIEPLIEPLGFDWRIGIGLLASFAAREVFVSTLATVYNLEDESESVESLTALLQSGAAEGHGITLPAALALLVFYVFACQCMSTLAVCRRETGSWKWPLFMFSYMTALAYLGALFTYQVASALL